MIVEVRLWNLQVFVSDVIPISISKECDDKTSCLAFC